MIYEPKSLTEDKTLETEICIIGSGAGGAMAASKLANKHSITMLEKGPNVTGKDFTQNESESLKKLYQIGGALTTNDASIRILQGRALGGSTTVNWMSSFRTPEPVLEQWVEEFGLEDYQLKNMESHFSAVEKRLNVHKPMDEEHNPQNRIILDGCKNLGIHFDSIPNNSKNCIGCGHCGLGCYYDAKQDMRLTYLKDALATNNMDVYTGTEAEKIQYISKNEQLITGVTLEKEYGVRRILKVKAKRTIVAGSAIWTPVVFQKSKLTKNKTLGKYLSIHPVTLAIGKFDHLIDPAYGIPQSAYSHEYINMDGRGYGFWLEVPPVQPIMAGVNYPGMGDERFELMKSMRNSGVILVLVRDGANKKSNGEVKWNGKRLNLTYKLCKEDKAHMMKGLENALEVLFAAGAQETFTMHTQKTLTMKSPADIPQIRNLKSGPNYMGMFSAHPLGTARMGTNPQTSVVGPTMEMHDYPGIYIADGSTIPTALGVNPMVTILSSVSRAFELNNDLGL